MKWCYHNKSKQQFLLTWSLLRIILVIVRGCVDKSEIVCTCVLCFSLILILQWMMGLVSLTVVVGNGHSVVVVRVRMMIEFVLLLLVCVYVCQCVCVCVRECVWCACACAWMYQCVCVCVYYTYVCLCVCVCVCITYKSVFVMNAVFLNHSFFNSCWLVWSWQRGCASQLFLVICWRTKAKVFVLHTVLKSLHISSFIVQWLKLCDDLTWGGDLFIIPKKCCVFCLLFLVARWAEEKQQQHFSAASRTSGTTCCTGGGEREWGACLWTWWPGAHPWKTQVVQRHDGGCGLLSPYP